MRVRTAKVAAALAAFAVLAAGGSALVACQGDDDSPAETPNGTVLDQDDEDDGATEPDENEPDEGEPDPGESDGAGAGENEPDESEPDGGESENEESGPS